MHSLSFFFQTSFLLLIFIPLDLPSIFGLFHYLHRWMILFRNPIFYSQLAVAYNEALLGGKLTNSRGGIVQSNFLGSLKKRVDELLNCCEGLKDNFHNYMISGTWPAAEFQGGRNSILLSWYLQWFGVPAPSVIKTAAETIRPKLKSSSFVPVLHLLFPSTDINVIGEINKFLSSNDSK